MRRLLRKIATDKTEDLGNTSTLAKPAVVAALVAKRAALATPTLPKG